MTQTSLRADCPPTTAGSVQLIGKWRIDDVRPLLALAEYTGDDAQIRRTLYRRATLRGVPGKHADMIVADSCTPTGPKVPVLEVTDRGDQQLPPGWLPVLELADKAGRYNRAVRRRYAIRPFMRKEALALPLARLRIDGSDPEWLEIMIAPIEAPAIVDRFPRLRSDLEDYDLQRVAGWHWRRWFTHLRDQDGAREACDAWAAEVRSSGLADSWTIAEANRAASRMLYRFSRDLGWRKLTARERERLGLGVDAPQWWHTDALAGIYAAMGHYHATGCGDASLIAASQGHWPALDGPLTDGEIIELEFDEAYPMR